MAFGAALAPKNKISMRNALATFLARSNCLQQKRFDSQFRPQNLDCQLFVLDNNKVISYYQGGECALSNLYGVSHEPRSSQP